MTSTILRQLTATFATALASAALTATAVLGMTADTIPTVTVAPAASFDPYADVIMEDDPRWDCRVHGNGICGPGAVDGRRLPSTDVAVPTDAVGDCASVEWHRLDRDGQPFTPVDANLDGMIDCGSDIELGA